MRMPIKDCAQLIEEMMKSDSVPPVLELWHLKADPVSWLNLASSLTSGKTVIPKIVLHDVVLKEDEAINGIVEACVGVRLEEQNNLIICSTKIFYYRTCELDALGKSFPRKLKYFWSILSQKLNDSESIIVLETLVFKQTEMDNDAIESIANCIINVKHVIMVNIEMNKKQWARFALEINRTEKKLQTLGTLKCCN